MGTFRKLLQGGNSGTGSLRLVQLARDFGAGKTEWEPWARCNGAVNLLQVQWSRDPGRGAMGQEP